ncbi:hypothetical protein ACTU6U_01850 [Microbacterium sp. A196]|uniref:hypothetical protein n=1 Tax=Microbacterium sp. A196 TaxID=3457320 RepID=UPI003FD05B27
MSDSVAVSGGADARDPNTLTKKAARLAYVTNLVNQEDLVGIDARGGASAHRFTQFQRRIAAGFAVEAYLLQGTFASADTLRFASSESAVVKMVVSKAPPPPPATYSAGLDQLIEGAGPDSAHLPG